MFNPTQAPKARLQKLLFIEPAHDEAATPIIDSLTRRMAAALRHAISGCLQGGHFAPGSGWRGWHTCECGAMSGNHDLLLPNGMVTNSLCVHYLARHRLEVPQEELHKVLALPAEECQPTWEQLNPRKVPAGWPSDRKMREDTRQRAAENFVTWLMRGRR